ncbi:TetR/AcrR family transcriptional regulator C-terminal domain-containing protein [Mycobacterium sp. 1274756.6]|uniref:TetR/AcrR family transcriptional regulator n=1 Tax=Mycobacterium sp. 1274756.6 TaxID=1834076 RepID=UPI00080017BE|nr:TetR/AcrR family transcriptional regulator C-terminal domain-containing protein [Mycobacterium sp. 1274756.6]OBJ71624.1 TetR family transcriptional regulator [Mycobacterium sp. 1274756.6]
MPPHKRDPRAEIVAAAAGLLDRYGIADLTMRRLARDLELTPGALYWHFANKQELLGAVADRLLAPVRAAGAAPGWRERIEGLCLRLRDALLSHTDGAELVAASHAAGQSATLDEVVARLAGAAAEAGFGPGHAELAARTVLYYVLGFTVDEQSRRQWDAAGSALSAQAAPAADPDRQFAFGLNLVIDGLAAHQRVPVG